MGVIREGRLKDGHGGVHLYCGEDGNGGGGIAGPSVVELLEAAMVFRCAGPWPGGSRALVAICCGKHVGVCDRQSGVGINGDAVENLEECLLVGDERFDLGHGNLQLLDELFPLLRDE
jgi:hypothetical protein